MCACVCVWVCVCDSVGGGQNSTWKPHFFEYTCPPQNHEMSLNSSVSTNPSFWHWSPHGFQGGKNEKRGQRSETGMPGVILGESVHPVGPPFPTFRSAERDTYRSRTQGCREHSKTLPIKLSHQCRLLLSDWDAFCTHQDSFQSAAGGCSGKPCVALVRIIGQEPLGSLH